MFETPTIEDFIELIDWHIKKALERADRAVSKVRAEASMHGAFNGGRRILLTIEAARAEFETGIDAALGELKRTIHNTKLDSKALREHLGPRLEKFAENAKKAAQVDDAGAMGVDLRKYLDDFNEHLKFALRQFDVGLFNPSEPEVPPMTGNTISVGYMAGNIAQGSPGATQSFEFKLNVEVAQTALQTLEAELSKIEIADRVREELAADIATIKAQLSKSSPSITILHEAGRSVRSIAEGIAAGILTSPFLAAATALGSALGLK